MTDISIKVDSARFSDMVTVDEWLALYDNDPRAMVSVMSRFVVGDDGRYLEPEAGRAAVGKLTISQLRTAAQQFMGGAQESAVPKASAAR